MAHGLSDAENDAITASATICTARVHLDLPDGEPCNNCKKCPGCGWNIPDWRKLEHRGACQKYKDLVGPREPLDVLVEWLADRYVWNWTVGDDNRANRVLHKMAEVGLIKQVTHPHGGYVWIVGKNLYGRTDGLMLSESGNIVEVTKVVKVVEVKVEKPADQEFPALPFEIAMSELLRSEHP